MIYQGHMVSQWLNWISGFGFWAINSGFFRENHEFFNPFIHGSQIALEVKEKKKKKKRRQNVQHAYAISHGLSFLENAKYALLICIQFSSV